MARSLKKYESKRNFTDTPEPKPKKKSSKSGNMFVVQKHEASHLHYDFRLEIDGVLVSWAIPKGPSLNPSQKRLAVMTEDHPIDYGHFEGIIPEGNYGAGTVMVWDIGTYENIKEKDVKEISMEECLKKGTIEIILKGKKLKGAFALVHSAFGGSGKNWLLIKMRDKYASETDITNEDKSALSKKTMAQIEKSGKEYNG